MYRNPYGPRVPPNPAQQAAIQAPGSNAWRPPQGRMPPPPPPPPAVGFRPQSAAADVYTPTMTAQAVNQARAQSAMQGNPEWLARQYDRPGMGRTAGTMARVVPQMAQARAQGDLAAAQIPWEHAMANQQNALAGQAQRSQQAQGLAGIQAGMGDAGFDAMIQQLGLGQGYRGLQQGYRGLGQQYLGQGISDQGFAQNEQMQRQNQLMNMLFPIFGALG